MQYVLNAVMCGILVSGAGADWNSVNFSFKDNESNTVQGPNQSFTSVRPPTGVWTACFGLSNHFANLKDETIRVWSAGVVTFEDYNVVSGNAGMSSHLCLHIQLSEPVTAATWDIGTHGRNVSPSAVLAARYSTDGQKWTTAHVYPPGFGADYDPPPLNLSFDPPTQSLHIGWFAEVPQGQTGWWNQGTTGTLTFTPVRNPAGPTVGASEPGSRPACSQPTDGELRGRRFVPNTFFGTTTHVNSEGAFRLLNDLNIHNVRTDVPWAGLEPSRGNYNFASDLWMIASADLGVKHKFDQLVVLTSPPAWALAEHGTFPNDQSVDALEECMFRLASRYKGKICHWQAMNEPNMALWKGRFVTFLKAFYRGVKRADPQNKVILCGFAGVEAMHLDAVYRLGGKDYFDILDSHSYTRPALPEDGGYIQKIQALHDVMKKYGDDKPLWVSEMGWNGVEPSMIEYMRAKYPGHREYAVSEEDQARGLARLYLISATIPWIERVYFFHLHQEAAYTDTAENVDYYMGLFTPWLEGMVRPKDAYFAVKTVVRMLNESTFLERIEVAPRIWALLFERGQDAIVAVWSLDDHMTMTLKDASSVRNAISMVGTPVLIADNKVPLSGRPVYLLADRQRTDSLKQQIRTADVQAARPKEISKP